MGASAKGMQIIEKTYDGATTIVLPSGPVCFVRKGAGPPVLLLHGAPLSLLTWRNNIDALASELDVLAIDMKGFGMSYKGPGDYSPAAHARFVIELLDHLDIKKISIVGSSYGCAVAFALALEYTERTDKLVLINSVGHPTGPHSLEKIVRIGLLRSILKPTLRSSVFGKRMLASRLQRSYANPNCADQALVDAYFHLLLRESGERTFLACLEALDEAQIARDILKIANETLILWGQKDHVLPVQHAYQFKQEIRNSRIEILPNCGHFPHEEDPAEVNRQLRQFLAARETSFQEISTFRHASVAQ